MTQGPRSTNDRLRRLLVMLPWLMERGDVPVAEVARRFELSEAQVVADLELVAMCGLPPYQDEMVDLFIDEGVVHVGVPRLFTRPLRLTAPEGFALLAAARSAMELPGADPDGALARALEKLAGALGGGAGDGDGVVVDLRRPPDADVLADATSRGERLRIVYWTAARDERTERTITPRGVFHDRGHWYVVADDHRSGAERVFRVDRIESMVPTGVTDAPRAVELPDALHWFSDDPSVERVVLDVAAPARWLVERLPVESITQRQHGRVEVVLPVVNERWLAGLLLRGGTDVRVVEPQAWRALAALSARAVLDRYERSSARSDAVS